jgi:hypothetical protein
MALSLRERSIVEPAASCSLAFGDAAGPSFVSPAFVLVLAPCFAPDAGFVLVAIASSFSSLLERNADQPCTLLREAFRAGDDAYP